MWCKERKGGGKAFTVELKGGGEGKERTECQLRGKGLRAGSEICEGCIFQDRTEGLNMERREILEE